MGGFVYFWIVDEVDVFYVLFDYCVDFGYDVGYVDVVGFEVVVVRVEYGFYFFG